MPSRYTKKGWAVVLLIILGVMLCIFNYTKESFYPPVEQVNQQLTQIPSYEILNQKVYDIPLKTEITQHIKIQGHVSDESLRQFLLRNYVKLSNQHGYKYHDKPTNIYIYVYASKEDFESGMGRWIAMLDKNHSDINPNIKLNNPQISQSNQNSELKFGFTEDERKKIYLEMQEVQYKSNEEADRQYPLETPLTKQSDSWWDQQMKNHTLLQENLYTRYKEELAFKYNINVERLDEISKEGNKKLWPLYSK